MSARWPLLLSVPHAGLEAPAEVTALHQLTAAQIAADGDVGAAEIYRPLEARARLVTTEVARAFVDMNRAQDDFRKDGVVKTHTCWDVPIYLRPLTSIEQLDLVRAHHAPYHRALSEAAAGLSIGLDLHTMAAHGPPVGPDPGVERPWICLGDAGGAACPPALSEGLRAALAAEVGAAHVTVNQPFSGGYITRSRPGGIRWLQVEMSRAPWASDDDKRAALARAIDAWLSALAA